MNGSGITEFTWYHVQFLPENSAFIVKILFNPFCGCLEKFCVCDTDVSCLVILYLLYHYCGVLHHDNWWSFCANYPLCWYCVVKERKEKDGMRSASGLIGKAT